MPTFESSVDTPRIVRSKWICCIALSVAAPNNTWFFLSRSPPNKVILALDNRHNDNAIEGNW